MAFHEPVKPMQNGFVESFNGRMRDGLLNETVFFGCDGGSAKIAAWVADFNLKRPHSALGYMTPAYPATFILTTDRMRDPDQIRRRSLLLFVSGRKTRRDSPLDESSAARHAYGMV
jgi:putative transposase